MKRIAGYLFHRDGNRLLSYRKSWRSYAIGCAISTAVFLAVLVVLSDWPPRPCVLRCRPPAHSRHTGCPGRPDVVAVRPIDPLSVRLTFAHSPGVGRVRPLGFRRTAQSIHLRSSTQSRLLRPQGIVQAVGDRCDTAGRGARRQQDGQADGYLRKAERTALVDRVGVLHPIPHGATVRRRDQRVPERGALRRPDHPPAQARSRV